MKRPKGLSKSNRHARSRPALWPEGPGKVRAGLTLGFVLYKPQGHGANIHIVSGSEASDDNGNSSGIGNLTIGYDENPLSADLAAGEEGHTT